MRVASEVGAGLGALSAFFFALSPVQAQSTVDLNAAPWPADCAAKPLVPAIDAAGSAGFEQKAPPEYGPPPLAIDKAREEKQYDSFGSRVGAVKWELGGLAAILTATNVPVVLRESQSFRFKSEGFFGKDTSNIGVDKLAHAWNTYMLSGILYERMARKTGGGPKSAMTAAILGLGLQTYGEIYDGFHEGGGFSWEDMAFNTLGAGFEVARNSVPGLAEKVDFRLMIVPNEDIVTFRGRRHFEQQWFLLALKPSGFERFRSSPLRFVEFHVGYHAKDFDNDARAAGLTPKRKPFVGIGLNVAELFLNNRRGTAASLGRSALTYLQIPYTAVHLD